MTALKPKVQIKLKKHEHIIAVVPEYCDGPGWCISQMETLVHTVQRLFNRMNAIVTK